MAVLEKIAFIIEPNTLWDWERMLPQNFLIAHLNPESIKLSPAAANFAFSGTPGSPVVQNFYLNNSAQSISFNLEFDDTYLIMTKDGTKYKRLNTQDSIDWLQIIQLPDINGWNDVGLEFEPPSVLFVWGDRSIFSWKLVIGEISENRVDKVTKKTISASVGITLYRDIKSFIR